jgi:SAM-dependent methyltransferase
MRNSIIRVDKNRWERAQEYELNAWKKQNAWFMSAAKYMLRFLRLSKIVVGDDWNCWWGSQFDNYDFIPKSLENVIELGCGPYTNMRIISDGRHFNNIICSDPLAKEYINFTRRWLSKQYHKGNVLIDNHPIEECPFKDNYFDLVILINVLDHVQDAELCLQNATRILKPGGYFIFGQDLTDDEDAEITKDDIGHPIKISHDQIDSVLLPLFKTSLYKVLSRNEGRNPKGHYGTYCFIGNKLDNSERG